MIFLIFFSACCLTFLDDAQQWMWSHNAGILNAQHSTEICLERLRIYDFLKL